MMLLLARHPNEKWNKRFDKILHLKLIQKKLKKHTKIATDNKSVAIFVGLIYRLTNNKYINS